MNTVLRIFAVACLLAGCAGLKTDYDIGRERAQTYLAAHPKLALNTAEAIGSNSILEGMTMEQVIASWGPPVATHEFRGGEVQYVYFGCDWPHHCESGNTDGWDVYRYQSRALFENGVVVDWRI